MPHVTIKHFPQDFTEQQQRQLAAAITEVITHHFGVIEGAVSVAVEPVEPADWNDAVYGPEIAARQHLLIKRPDYGNN